MNEAWDHQSRAEKAVIDSVNDGQHRICLTAPTGAGKTRIVQMILKHFLDAKLKCILYSNRKLLIEQLSQAMHDAGFDHGVRAAGYDDERERQFQVSSVHTERSRLGGKAQWQPHDAKLAVVDEAHINTTPSVRKLLDFHIERGGTILGCTATPLGIGHSYEKLIEAGKLSEMFACKALVPALHYGPDEPDLRKMIRLSEGEDLSEAQQRSAIRRPGLWGRIWKWFEILNPEHKPTICFGPDVSTSVGICQSFCKKGVPAAHIDGAHVWVDGELHNTTAELRRQVLEASKDGRIKVLCNRFVLREGIDAPWLSHGIFATVFGSLQTYLQSGGRLLRASSGLDHVTIQDHGGNWWRHGSLNEDRDWCLDWDERTVYGIRADRLRGEPGREPFLCPACGRVWGGGSHCNPAKGGCGRKLEPTKRVRQAVTIDGDLVELEGTCFKPRPLYEKPNGPELWRKMYYRARSQRWNATFNQAAALFAYENQGRWPDPNWPFLPVDKVLWWRKVADVPREALRMSQDAYQQE